MLKHRSVLARTDKVVVCIEAMDTETSDSLYLHTLIAEVIESLGSTYGPLLLRTYIDTGSTKLTIPEHIFLKSYIKNSR